MIWPLLLMPGRWCVSVAEPGAMLSARLLKSSPAITSAYLTVPPYIFACNPQLTAWQSCMMGPGATGETCIM